MEFQNACSPKTVYAYQKCHEAGLTLVDTLSSRFASSVVKEMPTLSKRISTALENSRYSPLILVCHIMDVLVSDRATCK